LQGGIAAETVVLDYVAFYKAGRRLYAAPPPLQPAEPALLATTRRVTNGWH
jgi:hypothetical protein